MYSKKFILTSVNINIKIHLNCIFAKDINVEEKDGKEAYRLGKYF